MQKRKKEKRKEKREEQKEKKILQVDAQIGCTYTERSHSPQAYLFRTCKLNRSIQAKLLHFLRAKLISHLTLELGFLSSCFNGTHPLQNKVTVLFTWVQPSFFICLSYFHSTSSLESRNDADLDMLYCYISKSNQNKQKQKTPSQDGLLSEYSDKCISIYNGEKKVDLNPPQNLTLESKSSHANEVNKKFLKDEIQNGQ